MTTLVPVPPPAGCPELDPAAALLVVAMRGVLRSPAVELPGPVAVERLRALLAVGAQLTAAQAESVRDLGLRELYALDGAGSTNGWLRQQDVPVLPGAQPVAAERLARWALVEAAVRRGVLAPRSAELVVRAVEAVPDNPALLQDGALEAVGRDGGLMLLAAQRGGELWLSASRLPIRVPRGSMPRMGRRAGCRTNRRRGTT